jgi:hypothetical protein
VADQMPVFDDDLADRLNDAWAELRTLPLGGRGHLADICLEAAAAVRAASIARVVARHWRDHAMARGDEPKIEWRAMAHPLALVLCALDGEQDPIGELGVEEGPDADRIRVLAAGREGTAAS